MQEITDESAKYKTHQGLNRKEEYPKQSQNNQVQNRNIKSQIQKKHNAEILGYQEN